MNEFIQYKFFWVKLVSSCIMFLWFIHFLVCFSRSFGEGNGTPLRYSWLENPRGRGAWWAAVHGVQRVGHDWATSLSLYFRYWILALMVSAQFSCSVIFDPLRPHGLQQDRLPCPSPTPGAYLNSCPANPWCHPTISSSVFPFSSCTQSFKASGSFPMSQFFASGGQRIGVSASALILPMNI